MGQLMYKTAICWCLVKHTLRNALQVVTAEWEAQRFVRFSMQFGVINRGISLSTISKMQSQNLHTDTAVTYQYHYTC